MNPLLQDVLDNKSDDLPRLVYADYLDQKLDEPNVMDVNRARAELIRKQIQLKNLLSEWLENVNEYFPLQEKWFSPLAELSLEIENLSNIAFSFLIEKDNPDNFLISSHVRYDKILIYIGRGFRLKVLTVDRGFIENAEVSIDKTGYQMQDCFFDETEIITGKLVYIINEGGLFYIDKIFPDYLIEKTQFIFCNGTMSPVQNASESMYSVSCSSPEPIKPQGVIEVPVDPVYSERPVKNSRRGSIPDHLKNNHWNRRPGRRY